MISDSIKPVCFGTNLIGPGNPCFIIAEAGVNHNGDINIAHKMIDAASDAGVDSIKFQSFIPKDLVIPEAPKAEFQIRSTGQAGSQYDILKSLELSIDQLEELKIHCEKNGLLFLCTPYENVSVDLLDRIHVAGYKIASTDTTNIPFLKHIAKKGRPVILSTGMCSLGEVEEAIQALAQNGLTDKIILMQCTAEYPSPYSDINLRVIHTFQQVFQCPVGFSDHTPGIGATPWSIPFGACVIEKHFTLDRSMDGPDHVASIEPKELKELVQTIRNVEIAIGDGIKKIMPSETANKIRLQKSLVARTDIQKGERLSMAQLTCKRPGSGISPARIDEVIGAVANTDICKDEILRLKHLMWE